MKTLILFGSLFFILTSCAVAPKQLSYYDSGERSTITQSLFKDETSTISEEDIQKILASEYEIPNHPHIAIVKLKSTQSQKKYAYTDENYLKAQQSYVDMFVEKFQSSDKVKKISLIPTLLLPDNPSFTNIREAAVRTQADMVAIYTISSDIYTNYKVFAKTDIKAFATTQLILMDVRTGLIPFSAIVTKDFESQKQKEESEMSETINRIKNQAVLLTIEELGEKIVAFLEAQ